MGQLRVHYYRAGSAASRMQIDRLDVHYLLSGQILHLTGITAALSESCHELIDRLIFAANDRGVTVSFDVNVRRGLLNARDPREVLGPLAARADLVFLSEDEAKLLFGGSDSGYVREALQDIRAATVVVHRAEGAFAVEETGVSEMAAYPVDVVDTVGAGDAFVAGFLSGRLRGWNTEECLDMANACGACAVTVPGDLKGLPTAEEALALRRGLGAQDAER
jgi:2-dehydro-3-deoxygluconokinase